MTLVLVLLVATVALIGAPAITHRVRRRMRPADSARVEASSLITGLVLAEAALAVCAAPILVVLVDAAPFHRLGAAHLFPGGRAAGLVSLIAAVAFPTYVVYALKRTVNERKHIAAAARVGSQTLWSGDADVVMYHSHRAVAFAVPGHCPVVVVSDRLCEELTAQELDLVMRHELAHVRHHSRLLLLIGILDPLTRFVPFLSRSVDVLRLSVERWADETAAETPSDRRTIKKLLLKIAVDEVPAGVAALTRDDQVRERTNALDLPRPESSIPTWMAVMGLTLLISTALVALVLWIG